MKDRLHPLVRIGTAGAVLLTGCRGLFQPTPSQTREPTPITSPPPDFTPTYTPIPSATRTPTITPSPTPNILETQRAQWIEMENKERKDPIEIFDAEINRILIAGDFHWVEANIPGEEGIVLLQSNCIKTALEESGELGRQVDQGEYTPGAQIDVIRGNVKIPSDLLGRALKSAGIPIPVIDLSVVENNQKTYDCDVVTTDEGAKASLKDTFNALKPLLERVYPRIKQFGNILGNLLDLAEQESEALLTPSP